MVVRMRVTRSHRDNRRSHHGLKEPRLSKCSNCGAYHLRHRMCKECGHYRGRVVVDVTTKLEKKLKKREEKMGIANEGAEEQKQKEQKSPEPKNKKTESKTHATQSKESTVKKKTKI